MIWLGWVLVGIGLALAVSYAGEGIGWAFYDATMAQAARRRERRELARMEWLAAQARCMQAQLDLTASVHQHAHTVASLTGQAVLVTQPRLGYGLMQLMVTDPRHNPWQFPPS